MKNLKKFRVQKGMTQKELSERSGVSQSVISKTENGISKDIYLSQAEKLASALGITLNELAGEEVNKK